MEGVTVLHQRVIEDSRSSKLAEPCIGNAVTELPSRQRNRDNLALQPASRDQSSYKVLHCDEPSEIEFSSREFCAVIAIGDGDIRIRKDLRIVYDGYMPTGTLCFMALAKSISFEPSNSLSFMVLRADQRQVEALVFDRDLKGHGKARRLDDFNARSNDVLCLSSTLLNANAGSQRSLTCELFEKVLLLAVDAYRPQKLPWWRLRRVKEYVRENISGRNCLPELAEVAGLSRMHFAAQFKAATCLSPHEFVLQERSRAAAAMLSKSAVPIIEIALSVGFQNQAHFSTVFKAIMGVTPAMFRRKSAHRDTTSQSQRRGFANFPITEGLADQNI